MFVRGIVAQSTYSSDLFRSALDLFLWRLSGGEGGDRVVDGFWRTSRWRGPEVAADRGTVPEPRRGGPVAGRPAAAGEFLEVLSQGHQVALHLHARAATPAAAAVTLPRRRDGKASFGQVQPTFHQPQGVALVQRRIQQLQPRLALVFPLTGPAFEVAVDLPPPQAFQIAKVCVGGWQCRRNVVVVAEEGRRKCDLVAVRTPFGGGVPPYRSPFAGGVPPGCQRGRAVEVKS